LFNAVQPHFTAAPILQDIEDPIRRRYALVEGAFDEVPLDCTRRGPMTGTSARGLAQCAAAGR
jgi:hypothetical protein